MGTPSAKANGFHSVRSADSERSPEVLRACLVLSLSYYSFDVIINKDK
jgi:hypothetical protein